MTKVLAFHERNRVRGVETGIFRSSSSRSRGPVLGSSITSKQLKGSDDAVNGIAPRSEHLCDSSDMSFSQGSASGRPDVETMSQDCLKVRAQNGSVTEQAREKRRSVRHQLTRQHEDQNAQLFFDVVNIRKKLNFKENSAVNEGRARKRIKRETITCHCHITIWDNRLGLDQKEPIVRKSELCDISTSDLGTAGYLAEIKLQKPFIFKSSELKVSLDTPTGQVLGIGDKYFLEIKIIPTKNDVEWPPIPILGRSEGDQTSGLGRTAAEKLQNTLCARYMHLPQAPTSEVPLSVFFLHEGSTYRSKYGLEVNAMWTKGQIPEAMMMKQEEEQPPALWSLDEEGRSFGRRGSPKGEDDRSDAKAKVLGKQSQKVLTPVKVVYNIDAASAKGVKDFRRATVRGLQCPTCPKQTFSGLEELQFHFSTCHTKYKFSVEKQVHDTQTDELSLIIFKISTIGTARPRNQDREPRKSEKDVNWQAPTEPLDVHAYVNGDQNWVEQNWVEGSSKKQEKGPAAIALTPDPYSAIRSRQFGGFEPAQKGGFLPVEHVLPFRQAARQRHPVTKLTTMTRDKETMYTSVSHRQIRVGERARSESDDEMDDGWFVKKSLEALDIAAEKQNWTDEQRLLRRKWNQARLREKLPHARYLSDCLVRFVQGERAWFQDGGLERKAAFADFVDEFLQRRVINKEVIRDLWTIIHGGEHVPSNGDPALNGGGIQNNVSDVEEPVALQSGPKLTSRRRRAEEMLRLPPYTCATCRKPIEELRRHGVRCSEHECEAPGVWYHTKCIRCKRKDRLGWKCQLCIERYVEAKEAKGKEIAVD